MKYLSAASAEVNALLDLLKVCKTNGDDVEVSSVQRSYRAIAKVYANNARRSPMASQAKLNELLDALNVKVKECSLHVAESKADAVAAQYAASAKAAIESISVEVGTADDAGAELE